MMLALVTSLFISSAPLPAATITNGNPIIAISASTNASIETADGCLIDFSTVTGPVLDPTWVIVPPANFSEESITCYGAVSNSGVNLYYVSNGIFTVQSVITNSANTYATVECVAATNITNTSTFYTFLSYTNVALQPQTNCLVWNMVSQLQALTNSSNPTNWVHYQINGGMVTSNALSIAFNPNFWLNGVTNIDASYIAAEDVVADGYSTDGWQDHEHMSPVTLDYCVTAWHTHETNARVCVLPNGDYYTNWPIAWTRIDDDDLEVDLMAKTNPYVLRIAQNFNSQFSLYYSNLPVAVRQHCLNNGIYGWSDTFCSSVNYNSSTTNTLPGGWVFGPSSQPPSVYFGDYGVNGDNGDTWDGGDSSGAAYIILNNEAVLLGCAHDPEDCPALDTNVVNSMIAGLAASVGGPVETVTPFPLNYPEIQP